MPSSAPHTGPHDPLRPRNPLVTRRWIFAGIGMMIGVSLLTIYFALGLLFWQGQWQLILHPSHVVARTPASSGISFNDIRFDATETGQPRLNGWWIPTDGAAPRGHAVILYLHEERGSLSDALPDINALHTLGYSVFAFDPRGFGKSEWAKPSERHWNEDADAALLYLESVDHIAPRDVVLAGRGLGATVAANLTSRHPELPGLIMIDPQPPTLALLEAPRWTHILPVRMLARDRFDPTDALRSKSLEKLFLLPPNGSAANYVMSAAAPVNMLHSTALGDPQTIAAMVAWIERLHVNRH